ncbi:nitroreductase family deazaflavin-dependent oxidoreductase [Mycolicibacterium aubagnense]|uniref:Nitroreductase n=1 Tax=Mycolicibacterium aubagnense TaxID=319707 RepID=A0ABN5YXE9_9MYCO|nr:nitroreductase family deazaflavin-dependent oxidoreductase [Mycolicibacterium aubagnense]TLH67558.1 nitroreductase family deazaflavin-dependent oxidoreductase [Mycolicibacterium aubagnense]WGI31902.1 nitroreductase family deazaflavin-dependent oxidoreductase [Mycolicibacterium aubagnense]BBX86585.1 nitroreductase [Mycolicibacterium aubagnense]
MTTDGLTPSEQVALYEATDGREGGTLEDRPVVILTTVGVKSGELRKTPVMRIVDGHNYLAVASAGGATSHPAWYRNLVANPDVWLQDGATVRRLRAREAHGAEKTRLWGVAEQFWPHFPQYRASAGDREIPVIVLEPLVGGDN